jgi:SAM-dependent methyltransferase
MKRLIDTYLDPARPLSVLDIGSFDVNGSYRDLFEAPDWTYRGCDRVAGPNVDLVQEQDYRLPVPAGSIDLAISGQAFEHVEYFWLLFLEFARVLKPGGLIFLIAPSRGPEHRHPVDCWRFYPDGFKALAAYARLEPVEIHTDWDADQDPSSAAWGDTVGVFRKPDAGQAGATTRFTVDLVAGTLESWTDGDAPARRVDLASAEAGRELGDLLAGILWQRRGPAAG